MLIARFINMVMVSGKKSLAEKAVYSVLKTVSEKVKEDAVVLFEGVLDKVGPSVEVKSRRVGGATFQVPIEVRADRRVRLAMSWIIKAARGRNEKGFIQRLTSEFLDIWAGRGEAMKLKDRMHQMAEANRAFANYRW
jgi:small subunit ribosomal protein S7